MPGISFIQQKQNINTKSIAATLQTALHLPNYTIQTLLDKPNQQLHFTAYPHYPHTLIDHPDYLIFLEGKVYNLNQTELKSSLIQLVGHYFEKAKNKFQTLEEWAMQQDGEYLLFAWHKKTAHWFCCNDPLGRLPLYYGQQKDRLVFSREIGLCQTWLACQETDSFQIALQLLFGYTLGQHSPYKNIYTLAPASVLYSNDTIFQVKNYYQWNFEANHTPSLTEAAQRTGDFLLTATQQRYQPNHQHLLGLSGGLDSRLVAGGLAHLKLPFKAVTMDNHAEIYKKELPLAGQLAQALAIKQNWELIRLAPPKEEDFQALWRLKKGLNYFGMAFILPLFHKFYPQYQQYWTGDGGDKLFPDIRPFRPLLNQKDLIHYILKYHAVLPLSIVAKLSQIPQKLLMVYLHEHLDNYPEKTLSTKYIRFQIMERAVKWLFEGEDRNRAYFWSVTPLYSLPLFQYAMQLSPDLKKNYQLFHALLDQINPVLSQIPNANWGFPMEEVQKRQQLLRQLQLRAYLPTKTIKRFLKPDLYQLQATNEQLLINKKMRLTQKEIAALIPQLKINATAKYHLWTILKMQQR